MATDYKQYNYSAYYAGEPFPSSACGPTSTADLLDISPLIVADWMTKNGYAVPYHGTEWAGPAAALSAYGAGGRQLNSSSLLGQRTNSTFTAWEQKIQSGYMGILLMGNGISNYWTNGGHFIAIVKYENGRYLVYDPASAGRTGWHPFSDFAGNIKICYTSELKWGSQPVPTSTYTFQPKSVKLLDMSNDVLLLQYILCALGFYNKKLGLDRSFGNGTLNAVKDYQKSTGKLVVDGICGPATWTSLLKVDSSKVTLKQIKLGYNGWESLLLQEILSAMGLYNGELDSSFGPATAAAVKAFQQKEKIAVDGICGPTTWGRLIKL